MPIDFNKLPHEGIRTLIPYQPGKSIEELMQEKGLKDIIKMASNENPMGCSPLSLVAIHTLSAHTLATYPSPINHPLMTKLAQRLHINKDQLILSNGSDAIFNLLLNCFALHLNKHILTHDYAFSTYAIQAKALNIPVRSAAVQEDWHLDVEKLLALCDKQTALIFLANPNNPTGVLTAPHKIEYILERIPEETILVIDEAYYEFAASKIKYNSIDWLKKYPNLLITRTFSKIYGMAGLRLGYAMGHPELISLLHKVQLPFSVNQIALAAAYAALDDQEFFEFSLKINEEGMKQMQEGFDRLGVQYLPSFCNFLTFNCQEESTYLYNYLLNHGIIVRPLNAYQMNHYIRVSIGTQEQNKRFLDALSNYFHEKEKK